MKRRSGPKGVNYAIEDVLEASIVSLMLPREYRAIRLSQLRRSTTATMPIGSLSVPIRGWIRAVREAFGLSLSQLGVRLKITPQGVANLERSEQRRSIRLSDLDRVADAMGCEVRYVFLPRSGRWEGDQEAATHHSAELEDQGIRPTEPLLSAEEQGAAWYGAFDRY